MKKRPEKRLATSGKGSSRFKSEEWILELELGEIFFDPGDFQC
jgi:hypothetical protein